MLGFEREKHDENRKSYIITSIFEREPRLELWMAMSEEQNFFILLHLKKKDFFIIIIFREYQNWTSLFFEPFCFQW